MSDKLPKLPNVDEAYSEKQIKVVKGIEGIRYRPAMYIGDTGLHGLHSIAFGLIHDGVGEFQAGAASKISVRINPDDSLTYRNDGSGTGIELQPSNQDKEKTAFESQFVDLRAARWWSNKPNCLTVANGFHGPSSLVTANALSDWLSASNDRDGHVWMLGFQKGKLISPLKIWNLQSREGKLPLKRHRPMDFRGFSLSFKPDPEIFPDVTFDYELICNRMSELSFLIPGVRLYLRDLRTGREETFYHPEGLTDFVKHQNQNSDALFPEVFTHQVEYEGARVEVAFQPTNGFETRVYSFVNSEACNEGTHIKGFRAGLKQALDRYGKTHGLFLHAVPKIEHYYEGMTAVISVWLEDPMYEGPTRFKLGNVEMAKTVAEVVREGIEAWAIQRPDCIHQMIEKAVAAAEMDLS